MPYIYNMYKISIKVFIVNLILNITYAVDSRGVSYYNQYIWPFVYQKKSQISQKSLKIPKGQSETVYRRRTDNTMAKRKSTKGQTSIDKTFI